MRINELNKISKLYFDYQEIARVLAISTASARVTASRYVKKGILVKVKRNVYVLEHRWESLSKEESFQIANVLQVPSYISLVTALEFYGITTQVQRNVVESIAVKRTEEYDAANRLFLYTKISKKLYTGFKRENDFFIASAEKAFLDALYLKNLSRYDFDMTAIFPEKLDQVKIAGLVDVYPERIKKEVRKIWKI